MRIFLLEPWIMAAAAWSWTVGTEIKESPSSTMDTHSPPKCPLLKSLRPSMNMLLKWVGYLWLKTKWEKKQVSKKQSFLPPGVLKWHYCWHLGFNDTISNMARSLAAVLQWLTHFLCAVHGTSFCERSRPVPAWIAEWNQGLQETNLNVSFSFNHYTLQYTFTS